MYRSIRIQRFRCFRDFSLGDLAQVNLIAGRNGLGKTAFLEAMFLHCGATNPELALRIRMFRGLDVVYSVPPSGQAPWDSLFYNLDRSQAIEIRGTDTAGKARSLRLFALVNHGAAAGVTDRALSEALSVSPTTTSEARAWGLKLVSEDGGRTSEYRILLQKDKPYRDETPEPPFPAIFVLARGQQLGSDMVQRFSDLHVARRTEPVVEAMRILEPRIEGLSVNLHVGTPVVCADIGLAELLPIQLLGDGAARILSLTSSIAKCREGVVLIDEAEAGFHHSAYQAVWRTIIKLAVDLNVQLFATTHSHECLVAARNAAREFAFPLLRVHRMDRVGEDIESVTYDDDALDSAIDAGLEVR